jgi:hypothetical protein
MNILKLIPRLQELTYWGIQEVYFESGAYGGLFADCPSEIYENPAVRMKFEKCLLEKGWCFDEGTSGLRYHEKDQAAETL